MARLARPGHLLINLLFDFPPLVRDSSLVSKAAQHPHPYVAVLDLLRVPKAPPKQSAIFHAALDMGDVSSAFPILHSHAGSPDGVRRHLWQRRLPDHLPDVATTSATPFSEFPSRQTGFPFLKS